MIKKYACEQLQEGEICLYQPAQTLAEYPTPFNAKDTWTQQNSAG